MLERCPERPMEEFDAEMIAGALTLCWFTGVSVEQLREAVDALLLVMMTEEVFLDA